jgi:putative ABC transport system permease protein
MIRNYFILTLRNFLRNRNYTLINILGLSIGITACIVIFLIISYELAFDKFHSKYDSIYRIVQTSKNASGEEFEAHTPYPVGKAFRNDFPEIPLVTAMHYQEEVLVKSGTDKQIVENVLFADSLFFEVFDFKVLSGNPQQDLGEPGKVFLVKSLADKLLKGQEAATIKIDGRLELEVAGIIEDPPASSHVNFSMVVSMPSFTGDFIGNLPIDSWGMSAGGLVYMALPQNISPQNVNDRFKAFATKYEGKEQAEKSAYSLQPLKEIHFDEQFTGNPGNRANSNYSDLMIMGILGLFILVIACINFVNLATALAVKKSKEIGIRKTLGAKRGQLTAYFLGETFLLTFISVLISLVATEWLLTWLRQFLEKQLELNVFTDPYLLVFLVMLVCITTFFSGFYPAVILSGFNPVAVLKNKLGAQGSSGAGVRKVLVLFQFTIAQILIIGTLVIADQMQYFRDKPLGFEEESVINVPIPENKIEQLQSLRARLESNPAIQRISFSLGAPTSDNNFGTGFFLTEKGKTERYSIGVKTVDRHYLETYGIKLKKGRWFSEADELASSAIPEGLGDSPIPGAKPKYVYILNESAAKRLGFNDPEDVIGKNITTGVNSIDAEVVGVVEDFHVSSLHDEIEPVVLINFPFFYYDAGIQISSGNLTETISFIEKQWSEVYPEYNFEYQFLDEHLARLYRNDQRTFTMFKIFAGVSIFIGCLGLYGLISFMANQKLREVGIRKVMGASVSSIVLLFSKEFVKLIVLAFFVAAPVAWYFMDQWLNGFAYRIPIQWAVFAISIFSTLFIALLTVSYRAIRAATINPVETLRTE